MRGKKNNGFQYLNFALGFGLTLVITLYLLYKGGVWLDDYLGTEPLFTALGVLLALATVFRQLVGEIIELGQKNEQDEQKNNIKKDGDNR